MEEIQEGFFHVTKDYNKLIEATLNSCYHEIN